MLLALSKLFEKWQVAFSSKKAVLGIETASDVKAKVEVWAEALCAMNPGKEILKAAALASTAKEWPPSSPFDFYQLGLEIICSQLPEPDSAYQQVINGGNYGHDVVRESADRVDVFALRNGSVNGREHKAFLDVYKSVCEEWARGAKFTCQGKIEQKDIPYDKYFEWRFDCGDWVKMNDSEMKELRNYFIGRGELDKVKQIEVRD